MIDFFCITVLDFNSESLRLLSIFLFFKEVLEFSRVTFLVSFSSERVPKFTSMPYEIGGSKTQSKDKNMSIKIVPMNEVIMADFFIRGGKKLHLYYFSFTAKTTFTEFLFAMSIT